MAEVKLDGLKTLTGENLIAALNALDEKLPKGAYKPVAMGGRTFTDISPAYSTEEIGNHFGPLGIGWGYAVVDEHYNVGFATNAGKAYVGVVLRVDLWYAYTEGTDTHRAEWTTYGGNANAGAGPDEHFAWQGALTNALGKGWSPQGFQRTIYKGEDFEIEATDGGREAAPKAAPKSAPTAASDPGAYVLGSGKYKGEKLRDVEREHEGFCGWMVDNKPGGEVAANCAAHLEQLENERREDAELRSELGEATNDGVVADLDGETIPF